ncbi:MAG TPA: ketosteroid isomerase [Planctomycetaceae bacterium]|nr:ketosteroid isomerase [Planctomycetaceae bacterium]
MKSSNVEKIELILSHWVESTRNDKKDKILENHQLNAVIFDVLPPIQYQGKDAYRKSFDEWQPPFEIPCLFELSELNIHASNEAGFAHCIINCGGTLPDGKEVRDTVRATFCFVKVGDDWRIAHHHISAPKNVGE